MKYSGDYFKYDINIISKYVNMITLFQDHIMTNPFFKVHGGIALAF